MNTATPPPLPGKTTPKDPKDLIPGIKSQTKLGFAGAESEPKQYIVEGRNTI